MVQADDRRHKAQSEAASRLRPAFLQPDESLQRPVAVLRRNARTVVGDAEHERVAVASGRHHDL